MKLYKARTSDVILGMLVVAITAMLVLPIPTWLLDVLIVINLSFSLLLLLVGLYMPNALALLAFPALLLITTLFRLGLNVASARLILSQAYAGEVINAFGSFLIRGEVVVGIIIFSIVTIVNFIVIARGASRVSEVAARFALDALPGKQMMIDSDLRAGLITPEQARMRREDLQRESMLYGSMDGAMKFVQGDAVAGFFVILTNILGGMYLGLRGGMSFSDAVQTYTLLTVGDGLVSQIPALLISVCAGLVVTRVASSEHSTLGSDLSRQLFARPGAVFMAGIILILFGSLPGLPFPPFALVGVGFMATGIMLQRKQQRGAGEGTALTEHLSGSSPLLLTGGEPFALEDQPRDRPPLVIALDELSLFRFYKASQVRYREWWTDLQREFLSETGMLLPEYRVVALEGVRPASFEVHFRGSRIAAGTVPLDALLVDVNPLQAQLVGLDVIEEIEHPETRGRVFWTTRSPASRAILQAGQIRSRDFFEYAALLAVVFFRQHPEELLTLAGVHASLKRLDKQYPGLIADALSANFLSMPRLTESLQEFVRQGVSVIDFRSLVESVANFCSLKGISPQDDSDLDLQELVSYVRIARKRQIVSSMCSNRQAVRAVVLSDEAEAALEEFRPEGRGSHGIDPELFERLRQGYGNVMRPVRERGLTSVTLLCRSDLRPHAQSFFRVCDDAIRVLTFEELPQHVRIEQVGVWSV